MAKTNRREPVRATAADGTPIMRVPLAGGQIAIIDAADFDRLREMGMSDQWTFNAAGKNLPSYVRASGVRGTCRTLVTVARLIMGAGYRMWVRYHDGDPLNLRRRNLYLDGGINGGDADRKLVKAHALRADMARINALVRPRRDIFSNQPDR